MKDDAYYETLNMFKKDKDFFPISYHPCLLSQSDPQCVPHWHDMIEILLITEGTLQFDYQNASFTAHEGDVILISSNQIHELHLLSKKSWYHCIHIHPSFSKTFSFPLENRIIFPIVNSQILTQYFNNVLTAYHRYMRKKSPTRSLSLQTEALNLLSLIINYYSCQGTFSIENQNEEIEVAKMIILYIQKHISEPLTLEELSKKVHFSKTYICRAFRKHVNTSIVNYINLTRCHLAHTLLKENAYTIGECARFAGFSSMSYFSKTYQKFMGEYPSETRERYLRS